MPEGSSTATSIHITWKEPFNGNKPILKYFVQYKLVPDNTYTYNETTELKYNITNLKAGLRYRIEIIANNVLGNGTHVGVVVVTGTISKRSLFHVLFTCVMY